MKSRNFLCFFSLLFLSMTVQAKAYMDLDELLKSSESYLQQRIYQQLAKTDYQNTKITSHTLDSRLKLTQCDKALTFTRKSSSALKGNISIKVSCHSPHAWSIYTKHNIALEKNIIISADNLPKGHVLTKKDITYIQRDIYTQRSGYLSNQSLVIGKQLKRSINSGEVIYSNQLHQPNLIKKGDSVSVVAKVGSLSVITLGIALDNGRIGEQIDIKNRRSSRVIRAEITGPDTVKVIL